MLQKYDFWEDHSGLLKLFAEFLLFVAMFFFLNGVKLIRQPFISFLLFRCHKSHSHTEANLSTGNKMKQKKMLKLHLSQFRIIIYSVIMRANVDIDIFGAKDYMSRETSHCYYVIYKFFRPVLLLFDHI